MAAPIQVDADKQSAIQAGGTSIVVTKPTNLADDDVLYAFLARDNSSAADAVTAPSGWTKLGSSEIDNGTFTAGIYRKVIVTASGEPSNYTWSWGSSEKALAWIVRITGADTTTPEDATPSNNTGNSITPRALAVTTTTADTLLLACGGKSDKVVDNWTAPSGMTEFFDLVTTGGGAGSAHCSAGAAEVNQAGIGSTGNKDFTILAIKDWVTFLIVIRSAGGGTTFNQAVEGALTPTGDVVTKDIFKLVAGAVAPTGDISIKDVFKLVAGAVTPTGALFKETRKGVDGSITPTGALGTIIIVLQAVAGFVTPTGAITKRILKALAGAVAPTGVVQKDTQKNVAGVVAPTGDVSQKDIQKNVAGAVTPTGALATTIIFLKTVLGALAPTGALGTMFIEGGGGPAGVIYRRTLTLIRALQHRQKL